MGTNKEILLRVKLLGEQLDRLEKSLTLLGEKTVALADDLKASIAQLDTETTAIGTLITSLASRITNNLSDQDVTDIKAALTAEGARLTALAVDPTNPVPPPSPQLKAARAKVKP